jgi:hypothetical protein
MGISRATGVQRKSLDKDLDADKCVLGTPCRGEGLLGGARMKCRCPYDRRSLHNQKAAIRRTWCCCGIVHTLGSTFWSRRWVGGDSSVLWVCRRMRLLKLWATLSYQTACAIAIYCSRLALQRDLPFVSTYGSHEILTAEEGTVSDVTPQVCPAYLCPERVQRDPACCIDCYKHGEMVRAINLMMRSRDQDVRTSPANCPPCKLTVALYCSLTSLGVCHSQCLVLCLDWSRSSKRRAPIRLITCILYRVRDGMACIGVTSLVRDYAPRYGGDSW